MKNFRTPSTRTYISALSTLFLLFFPIFASASVDFSSISLDPLSQGLVGYWPFDGNTTNWTADTTADIADGNTGTLINFSTTTSPAIGKIGQALKFNGSSQFVELGNATNLQLAAGTISAWVRTTACSGSGGFCGIVAKQDAYSLFELSNGHLASYDWGASVTRDSGVPINDGKWHLVTETFQSGVTNGTTFYVDGVVKGSTMMTVNNQTVQVEIAEANASQFFNGTIDDVRIYNRVLSAQEIRQLYALGH